MKSKLFMLAALALAVPFAVSADFQAMGLGFVAPQVSSDPSGGSVVANPQAGEIVFYDTGTGGSFYGYDGTTWNQFSGGGAGTIESAYVKDVKSTGSNGGTCTSGSWQTRTLNTLEGVTSFISLNSNQITLDAGTYEIEATAPAYFISWHQAKLRNVTDSTDAILGTTEYIGNSQNRSHISGRITIASSKTFELQHRCSTTRATDGFGTAASFGSEVYSLIRITKVN